MEKWLKSRYKNNPIRLKKNPIRNKNPIMTKKNPNSKNIPIMINIIQLGHKKNPIRKTESNSEKLGVKVIRG